MVIKLFTTSVYNQLLGIKLRTLITFDGLWCISIQNPFGNATDHTRERYGACWTALRQLLQDISIK